MKKVLALIISVALMLTLTPAISAVSTEESSLAETYYISTPYEDIFKSESGEYALKVDDKTYLAVEKTDFSFSDDRSVDAILNDTSIPEEVRQSVATRYQAAVESGNFDATGSLFSPNIEQSNKRYTDQTIWYNYNGIPMYSYQAYYWNLESEAGDLFSGKSTWDKLVDLVDISINVGGIASTVGLIASGSQLSAVISVAGTIAGGVSILETLNDLFGTKYMNGSTRDYAEIKFVYDCVDQWTYGNVDGSGGTLGLTTQQITFLETWIDVYFYDDDTHTGVGSGGPELVFEHADKVVESEHFSDPWETAYKYAYSPRTEWLEFEVGDLVFTP